jgi:hypothetical protein
MARPADTPGKWRVRRRVDGDWLLSGLTDAGKRVRQRHGSEMDALRAGARLFPREGSESLPPTAPNAPGAPTPAPAPPTTPTPFDDWDFPRVAQGGGDSVNKIFGIHQQTTPPQQPPGAPPKDEVKAARDSKVKKENLERYKELCDLLGIGWVMGTRFLSEWATRQVGKEPCKISPGHANKLREAARDTFVELFGERQLKPWQLMILYTLAMPVSMMLQSRAAEKPAQSPASPANAPAASQPLKVVSNAQT